MEAVFPFLIWKRLSESAGPRAWFALLWLGTSLFPMAAYSQSLIMDGNTGSWNATAFTKFFSSPAPLDFNQVRRKTAGWRKIPAATFDGGMSSLEHWLRLSIKNDGDNARYYLTVPNNRLNFVDFWYGRDTAFAHLAAGDHLPLPRDALTSYPVLPLHLKRGESIDIFVRVRSDSSVNFSLLLFRSEEFGAQLQTNTILHILFLVFAAGNLLIQIRIHQRIGERAYWYIIGLVLSAYLYAFLHMGDGNRLLWPDWIWGKNRIHVAMAPLAQMFLLLFCRAFLETRERSPRLDIAMRVLIGLLMIIVPLTLFPIPNTVRTMITVLATLGVMIFVIIATVLSLGQGRRSVLYLLASWVLIMLASGVYGLQLTEILPATYFTTNILLFVGPADIVVLSISVFSRQRQILREYSELKDRLESISAEKTNSSSDIASRRISNINSTMLLQQFVHLMKEEQFYTQEEANLSTAAQKLNVRVDQLSTVLSRELKSSFTGVLNQYRVLHARSLIENAPEKNLLEIALECGFGSRTSFNRVFKNTTGMPPREYREKSANN